MATNAWVDWGTLPNDIGRHIVDYTQVVDDRNSYAAHRFYGEYLRSTEPNTVFGVQWRERHYNYARQDAQDVYQRTLVHAGESFHPNADRTTPMERAKYAAMTALAVGTVGLGLASWQSTPKDERSKANTIASPEPTAKAINAKSEL